MDREKLGEVISAGVASGEAVEAEHLLSVFSYAELLAEVERRQLDTGAVAGSLAVAESEKANPIETAPLTPESLLATLDTALTTYSSLLNIANGERAKVKGRKKPEQLKVADEAVIRAEAEAIVANPTFLAELQAEADYFTKNPEAGSPEAGFDLMIVPEGLTPADNEVFAGALQNKINALTGQNYSPYVRSASYNDKRTAEITGKGYRIVVAPRHYNVASGTASQQTKQMKTQNQRTEATSLQTANDTEALAFINNLLEQVQIPAGSGYNAERFHQTYFRRFDQAPVDGSVSCVYVYVDGGLNLGRSVVRNDDPARALVVPKS